MIKIALFEAKMHFYFQLNKIASFLFIIITNIF